jgi:hypothetical protein
MRGLSTFTDDEIKAEASRRKSILNALVAHDPYHPRRTVSGIVNRLQQDRVHYKHQAVTIAGAKVWLDYHEYANAFGGTVWNVMLDVDGETYSKNITEAMCLDVEMGAWINYCRPIAPEVACPPK